MRNGFNCVVMIGNLVREPEVIRNNSLAKAFFTLAVDAPDDSVDYIDCAAFDELAVACGSFIKGTTLLIEGSIVYSVREDRNGNKIRRMTILCFAIHEHHRDGTIGQRYEMPKDREKEFRKHL